MEVEDVADNMVKQIKNTYVCEECKLSYVKKGWAEKCEAWCKEHKSCNLDIIKNSIKS